MMFKQMSGENTWAIWMCVAIYYLFYNICNDIVSVKNAK